MRNDDTMASTLPGSPPDNPRVTKGPVLRPTIDYCLEQGVTYDPRSDVLVNEAMWAPFRCDMEGLAGSGTPLMTFYLQPLLLSCQR